MKAIALTAMICLLPCTVLADCTSDVDGVVAYYPIPFSLYNPRPPDCTTAYLIDSLATATRFHGVAFDGYMDDNLSDNPSCRLEYMWDDMHDAPGDSHEYRTFFILTHGYDYGGDDSGFHSEYYSTENARDDEVDILSGEPYNFEEGVHFSTPDGYSQYYPITVLPQGVVALQSLIVEPDYFIGQMSCGGDGLADEWGVSGEGDTGPCILTYSGACDVNVACQNAMLVYRGLGCGRFSEAEGGIQAVSGKVIDGTSLICRGNTTNRLRCGASCYRGDGQWLYAAASEGEVRMAYAGEGCGSRYLVLSGADTVATFSGRGSDGHAILRCYSVRVPEGAGPFRCIEVDGLGRLTKSEMFSWSTPDHVWDEWETWDERRLDDIASPAVEDSRERPCTEDTPWCRLRGEYESWIASREQMWRERGDYRELLLDGGSRDCEYCAHVLVYAGAELCDALPLVAFQIQHDFGEDVDVRLVCSGSPSADHARYCLYVTWEANVGYGGGYPVDPGPTLILVGDANHGVQPTTFPDDEVNSCWAYDCRSYMDIGDFEDDWGCHDWMPECPVQVIPGISVDEISAATISAMLWNAGVSSERALFLGDDRGTEVVSNLYVSGLQHAIGHYWSTGCPVEFLKESEFGENDWYGMASAGRDAIEEGVRDIWIMGQETGAYQFTHFLSTRTWPALAESLMLNQQVMIFAPACLTADLWLGHPWPAVIRRLMFNDPSRTQACGLVGFGNAGWGHCHDAFERALVNEFVNRPAGTPYADIVYHATRTVQEQYVHYGRGIVLYGAYLKTPQQLSVEVEDDVIVGGDDPGVRCSLGVGVTDISFSLSAEAAVALDVYDVQGRLVANIKHGVLPAGNYVYAWLQRDKRLLPVAPGVYFARLDVRGESLSTWTSKICIVE